MERFICGFDWHKNSLCPAKTKELGVSNSVGRWMKSHRRFKMQALTCWDDAKVTSTHTAVGQFKGQFKGAMDEMTQKVQNASSHPWSLPHTQGTRSIQRGDGQQFKEGSKCKRPLLHSAHTHEALTFNSALEELSGKVQKASAG